MGKNNKKSKGAKPGKPNPQGATAGDPEHLQEATGGAVGGAPAPRTGTATNPTQVSAPTDPGSTAGTLTNQAPNPGSRAPETTTAPKGKNAKKKRQLGQGGEDTGMDLLSRPMSDMGLGAEVEDAAGGGRGDEEAEVEEEEEEVAVEGAVGGAVGGAVEGAVEGAVGGKEWTVPNIAAAAQAAAAWGERDLVTLALELCRAHLEAAVNCKPDRVSIGLSNHPESLGQCRTLGIETETRRKITKDKLLNRISQLDAEEQVDLMKRLWDQDERDYQYMVLDLLTDLTIPLSRNLGFDQLFDLLRHFIINKSGYDTVDWLAKYLINTLAYLEPPETWPAMEQWVDDSAFPWLQRAALLHQVCLGKYCDSQRLFKFCDKFLGMESRQKGFTELSSALVMALTQYARKGNDDKVAEFSEESSQTRTLQYLEKANRNRHVSPCMLKCLEEGLNGEEGIYAALKKEKRDHLRQKADEKRRSNRR